MRENKTNDLGRRMRYARRLQRKKAVSPVVATLILILIAVAAAAALYLWLVAWQGGVTKGIGSPTAQYTISIGGSTTVYPLDALAVPWFEQNNSDVVVNSQQGGSGAGTIAACSGAVDIGASSSFWAPVQLAGDGCPTSVVQTPIAYDGVDMIVDASAWTFDVATITSAHGLAAPATSAADFSLNQSVITAIYECNGNGTSLGANAAPYSPAAWVTALLTAKGVDFGVKNTNSCGQYGFLWQTVPFPAGCTIGTNCVYDTGTKTGDLIHIYHRADNSGTEQSFVSLLMGSACGTDKGNELSECGINAIGETGNPALLAAVATDPDGLGFNSNGIVYSTEGSSAASYIVPFEGPGQSAAVAPSLSTILAGVSANCGSPTASPPQSACTNKEYYGWRQLEYITVGSPTGESLRFIEFVTGSQVNQDLCTATGYISIYAPGAPPPTPVVD